MLKSLLQMDNSYSSRWCPEIESKGIHDNVGALQPACELRTSKETPVISCVDWRSGYALKTSRAVGSCARSGILHWGLTPHTVESNTSRAGLVSLSAKPKRPMAKPCLKCCCASSKLLGNTSTHPDAISFSMSCLTVSGSSSAELQLV